MSKEYQLFENALLWGVTADKSSYCQEGVSGFAGANWKVFGENGKRRKSIWVYRIPTSPLLLEQVLVYVLCGF